MVPVLCFVVLEEDHRLVRRQEPPRDLGELAARRSVRVELGDVLSAVVEELVADAGEGELRDVGGAAGRVGLAEVVARGERLARAAHDLEVPVRDRPALGGHRGIHDVEDRVEIHLLDVLRRVDAEARHAEPGQHDEVAGDLLPDRRPGRVEVGEREQLAVLDVRRARVVADRARRVEVRRGIEARVLVLRVGGAGAADAGAREVRHVVDDRIHVDPDANARAPVHHVRELGAVARAAAPERVAHRLVALAPVVGGRDAVLLRRRDLHRLHPRRPEHLLALVRDVRPFPLEQVDEHVARGHVPAGAVGLTERGPLRRG